MSIGEYGFFELESVCVRIRVSIILFVNIIRGDEFDLTRMWHQGVNFSKFGAQLLISRLYNVIKEKNPVKSAFYVIIYDS